MPATTTMTSRLGPEVRDKLARLAKGARRSRAFLAAEAVATYVERELAIIEDIQRGLADVEADRLVPHDDAMAELDEAVEASSGSRASWERSTAC